MRPYLIALSTQSQAVAVQSTSDDTTVQATQRASDRGRGSAVMKVESLVHQLLCVLGGTPHHPAQYVVSQFFELIFVRAAERLHEHALDPNAILVRRSDLIHCKFGSGSWSPLRS